METRKNKTLFLPEHFNLGESSKILKSRAAHCGDFGQSGLYSKAGGGESHCPTCRKLLCWQSEKKSPMLSPNPVARQIKAAQSIFLIKTYCFIVLATKSLKVARNVLKSNPLVIFKNNLVQTPLWYVHI